MDGVTDVGEWYVADGEHDRASLDQFDGAAGMLLGRKPYEGLAGFWPNQTGTWADMLNPLPKFCRLSHPGRPARLERHCH